MKKIHLIIALLLALSLPLVFVNQTRAVAQEKVNICHQTESESNPWEAIRVNDDGFWQGHDDHEGDFLYNGPVNPDNQQPLKPEGDEWCEGDTPTITPTPTTEPEGDKVNICHQTGSENNPWEAIRVNVEAFDGQGENDHTLHGDFLYNGPVNPNNQQPLKPEGDEWCEGVTPSVTPTPTPTSTPGGSGGTSGGSSGGSSEGSSTQSNPTQAVLGLSSTGSGENMYLALFQLVTALIFASAGYKLLTRNA